MSLSGSGLYDPPHRGDGNAHRHPWYPPSAVGCVGPLCSGDGKERNDQDDNNKSNDTDDENKKNNHDERCRELIRRGVLIVRNTLTGRKEPFVPSDRRIVKWYTCGPTVYDSAHVGHARTYLSLDIMRRVMTDYFRYHVVYQINTTDVDDKIILRARQNELVRRLDQDERDAVALSDVVVMVETALREARDGAEAKRAELQRAAAEAERTGDSRLKTEQDGLLEQHAVKTKNLEEEAVAITAALDEAKAAVAAAAAAKSNDNDNGNNGKNDKQQRELLLARSKLIAASKSVLAAKLDRERGHEIVDHGVFDRHARYYEREFMDDMTALNIRPPDVLTRVTEYVPQIVSFVEDIVEKGLAYVSSSGSVYLSLEEFRNRGGRYRKLCPAPAAAATSAAELAESEGALASSSSAGGGGAAATNATTATAATDDTVPEKRHPNDFALWKASKAGEPAWDSPWGKGRPGWHIECSVVATDVLGDTIDMHSGGEDLKFPHHDNEIAQSEAKLGCAGGCSSNSSRQWVNYFTHTGHLHIEGLKMSKSLKNFVTIRQALENNTARQLRIMFLLQAWDAPMNYSDQTVDDARSKESTIRSFFRRVEDLSRRDYLSEPVGWRMHQADRDLFDSYSDCRQNVHDSLLDNFNTRDAMLAVLDLINKVNAYLRVERCQPAILTIQAIALYVTHILKVFGVVTGSDDFGFHASSGAGAGAGEDGGVLSAETIAKPFIETLVDFREMVRNEALAAVKGAGNGGGGGDDDDKDKIAAAASAAAADAAVRAILRQCDSLRDETLPTLGVRLEDRPTGTQWNREDPETMAREIAERRAREAEAVRAKLVKRIAAKRKEVDKIRAGMVAPIDLFRTGSEFKEWNDDGVPTVQSNGEPVSAGQMKKKKKAIDKHGKVHADLLEKSGGDIRAYLAAAESELDELETKVRQLATT